MDLRPDALTWTGLLAQWVQFAQASLALPKNVEGDKWRQSVTHIINLQAVTFALAELSRLDEREQSLALDKAEMLIGRASDDLRVIWTLEQMSPMVREIIDDAAAAFRAAQRVREARGTTLIAASIAVHQPQDAGLARLRAEDAIQMGAKLVEWRVDALAEHEDFKTAIHELVEQSPAPCIVTCRSESEGGDAEADDDVRVGIYQDAISSSPPPRYIDVELRSMQQNPALWAPLRQALESKSASDLRTGLILSTHDFQGRPRDLLQRIEAMTNDPLCSVIKIAWFARSLRDNLEAFDLLRSRPKPMIALCMGQFGLMSRVLAKKFGGLLTFAVDREAEITAPGQPTISELMSLYRFDRIGPGTKVFGVIGWPVSHSQSPKLHNAGFEATDFDGVYMPMPIPPEYEHFKATVGALIDQAGLDFRGASVTIPHKENLLRFVKERGGRVDALAERIGAANTLIVGSAGGIECTNTDAPAAVESLCDGMGIDREQLSGTSAAVIGAGGVARALIAGLSDVGGNVTVFNRTFDHAAHLANLFGVKAAALQEINRQQFDIIVNCTPVGMHGGPAPDELPWASMALAATNNAVSPNIDDSTTVFDTVYTPVRTPLIQEAQARGARTITGVDMFIRQAALQFERWTGQSASRAAFADLLKLH